MRTYGTNKIWSVYGNYKPVERRRNNTRIAGWIPSTKQGESVSFAETYDDIAEVVIEGNTVQNQTTQAIANPLAPNVIPFLIGDDGKIDISCTNATGVFWLHNGTRYDVSRLQLTGLAENDIVWLCYESAASTIAINNNSVQQKIKLHLADLQGKITYYLRLYNCNQITGSLADLQGKITYYLILTNCNLITGVYTPSADIVWSTSKKYFYFDGTGMSTSDVDQTIINIANSISTRPNGSNGVLKTNARSSVSDAVVATLKSFGWDVYCGGVLQ